MTGFSELKCENQMEALEETVNYLNDFSNPFSDEYRIIKGDESYQNIINTFEDFERCLEKIVETNQANGLTITSMYNMADLKETLMKLIMKVDKQIENAKNLLVEEIGEDEDAELKFDILNDGYETLGKIKNVKFEWQEIDDLPFF